MYKHKLNIFPEMSAEERERLTNDIKANGFDKENPIILFEGQILDGWNRYLASESLGINAVYKDFEGSDTEAINFVMRTNKRRNLSSQQWATIAVEADEIVNQIQAQVAEERLRKQKENASNQYSEPCDNFLSQPTDEAEISELTYEYDAPTHRQNNTASAKLAKTFNTNRSYVNEVKKIKETSPEQFEQIKQGTTTISEVKKTLPKVEKTFEPESEFDEFTELAKTYGNKFQALIKQFKDTLNDAGNDFHAKGQRFRGFAENLFFLESEFKNPESEAWTLKRLVKCPNCQTKGCDHCTTGYCTKEQAESIKDIISYKGVTYNEYIAEKASV